MRHTVYLIVVSALPLSLSCDGPRLLGEVGESNVVSQSRGINQPRERSRRERPAARDRGPEFRTIDGTENHPERETLGAAGTALARWAPNAYADSIESLAGVERASARSISNAVNTQVESETNALGASDFLWQWGQFLDHDIDLTDGSDPPEPEDIHIPTGDRFFDPESTGVEVMSFNRSIYVPDSRPRQQLNEITHWIDGSNVYASEDERAHELRALDGDGKLKMSEGRLLPFNESGSANAGGAAAALFLAGDVRANEQVGLTAMHTLFVREHNRRADVIRAANPQMSGDVVYEYARQYVGALLQVITYQEYLPALLGEDWSSPYEGYDPSVDARIANMFSTAIYRYGHSALSPTLLRVDAEGREIAAGHLPLRNAFFNPDAIIDEGIEALLRGLATQRCQTIDARIIDDVRNFLFGPPGAGGFDLAALNIQRGRDHGLPGYAEVRRALGLMVPTSFAEISSDPQIQRDLGSVYETPAQVDLWVGALSEDQLEGAHVGELMHHVMVRQFEALRDGDRFWYARVLPDALRREVERTTLADVIRRNTSIGAELPDDVFHVF